MKEKKEKKRKAAEVEEANLETLTKTEVCCLLECIMLVNLTIN